MKIDKRFMLISLDKYGSCDIGYAARASDVFMIFPKSERMVEKIEGIAVASGFAFSRV